MADANGDERASRRPHCTQSLEPDDTPRKLTDSSKLQALSWTPNVLLEDEIAHSYDTFLAGRYRETMLGGQP